MVWVFDMDGVLIDSERAVRESYRLAGVTMPDDAWGKTYKEWGCPEANHTEKCRLYPSVLRKLGRRLHGAALIQAVGGTVLTSASNEAASAVLGFLQLDVTVIGTRQSKEGKLRILREYDTSRHELIYVDDDKTFGKRVMEMVHHSKFLHVLEQDGSYHLHHNGRVQRWTMSDWLPDMAVI